MSTLIEGRAGIWFYQLAATRTALQVEVDTGLSHSRGSVLMAARSRYGVESRTKRGALAELVAMVEGAMAENRGESEAAGASGPQRIRQAWLRGYRGHRERRAA
jgi:hypothetical protein